MAVVAAGLGIASTAAEAKTPGKSYCFLGVCHRVLTLAETEAKIGKTQTLNASHYDSCKHDRFNPCGLTSSGEAFNAGRADNAASPILPNGTIILVRNPANGKSAVLRVNNAGPYYRRRTLDVSRGAADVLGFRKRGVASLEVSVLKAPTKAEATYRRKRTYAKVPGYIGAFASIGSAGVHYAALTGQTPEATAVAALYPQGRDGDGQARPNLTDGNGIERTWLAKGMRFEPTLHEKRLAKATSARLAKVLPRSAPLATASR